MNNYCEHHGIDHPEGWACAAQLNAVIGESARNLILPDHILERLDKIERTLERLANNLQMVDHFSKPQDPAYITDGHTKWFPGDLVYDSVIKQGNTWVDAEGNPLPDETPEGWVGEGDSIVPSRYQDMADPARSFVERDGEKYYAGEKLHDDMVKRGAWKAPSGELVPDESPDCMATDTFTPEDMDEIREKLNEGITLANDISVREYNIGNKPTYRDLPLDERVYRPETLPYVIDKNGQIVPEHTLDPKDNPRNKDWPGWSS